MRADFEVAPGLGEELLEFHARLLVGGEAVGATIADAGGGGGGAIGDDSICVAFVVGRGKRLFEALRGWLLQWGEEIR